MQSTSRRIPHIYTCIETAHSVLPPNLQNKNPDTVRRDASGTRAEPGGAPLTHSYKNPLELSRRTQALDMLANQVGIYKNVEKLLQRLMQSAVCMLLPAHSQTCASPPVAKVAACMYVRLSVAAQRARKTKSANRGSICRCSLRSLCR